jgi:large subunit ribosomal protein L1
LSKCSNVLGTTSQIARPSFLPYQSIRCAATGTSENAAKYRRKEQPGAAKKKKTRNAFLQYDLRDAIQFSLCDAMHYIRAFEVGRNPTSTKYELHVKFRTLKNGAVVRNRLRLPHPVKTDLRICVICPPDSKAAEEAKNAGAVLIGEDEVFDLVKEGTVNFDRCIAHVDSVQKMNKAGLGRILGPRGLMPSAKTGSVVKDVAAAVKNLVGGSEYRERLGVVRMPIGQLRFTPEELQRNIKALMEMMKKDMAQISDRTNKEIHEVVLSSTNAPGFTLSGDFRSPTSVPLKDLSMPM